VDVDGVGESKRVQVAQVVSHQYISATWQILLALSLDVEEKPDKRCKDARDNPKRQSVFVLRDFWHWDLSHG